MFVWTMKHIILSALFIWLIHKIYNYFKLQLTVPKVKDLVNKPIHEYENMFKSMVNNIDGGQNDNVMLPNENNDGQVMDMEKKNEMKHELKKYLAEVTHRPEISLSESTIISDTSLSFDNVSDNFNESFNKKFDEMGGEMNNSMHVGYNLDESSHGKFDTENYTPYSFQSEKMF